MAPEWPVWRVVQAWNLPLTEVDQWSVRDIVVANSILDAIELAQEKAARR